MTFSPLLVAALTAGATPADAGAAHHTATPQHAGDLERGRLINAIVGVVLGPGLFLLLVGPHRGGVAAQRPAGYDGRHGRFVGLAGVVRRNLPARLTPTKSPPG